MKKLKDDECSRKMDYYSKISYPCIHCGRKMPIRYDKESVICSWCHHLIFRTEQEYHDYYNRMDFKQKLRRVMDQNEHNESTSSN